IRVAVPDLAGVVGNSAFDIRSDMDKIANAIADDYNKHGGIACGRKIDVKTYKINPVDSNEQHRLCLQMAAEHPAVVINMGGYVTPVSQNCFIQNHVLLETGTSIGAQQGRSAYPYLTSPLASSEQQVRDGILGAAARGFFKAPKFTKIGILEDNCLPSANDEIAKDLAASGVKSSQISVYKLDCALVAQPNQISAAVVRQRGASHVFLASSVLNNENYVRIATQQHFNPQYLTS